MSHQNLLHDSADDLGPIRIFDDGQYRVLSFAEGDEQRMMLMGLKRFTKYVNQPNVFKLRQTIAAKIVEENKYCF